MALLPTDGSTDFFFIDDAATTQLQQLRSMFHNLGRQFAVIQDGDKFDVLTEFDLTAPPTAPVRTLLHTHPARQNSSLHSVSEAKAIAKSQLPRQRLVVLGDNNQIFLVIDQAPPPGR
jgi:hypothetical protein